MRPPEGEIPGTPSPAPISTGRRRIAFQGRGREVTGEFMTQRAGCLSWARPAPWGPGVGNHPGLPDHPQVCLVSIEPVSDFILLEVYCQGRDAASWTTQLTTAWEGLPVEVVQVTSDEAKGLLAHARDGLGAHHSPDLFHVQHEVSKATGLALRSQTSQARADLDGARQQTRHW